MFSHPQFRLVLLLVSSAGALAVGFWLVPARTAIGLVQHAGYFVILAACIAFVVAAVRALRDHPRDALWSRADNRLALLCAAIALLWQLHGVHGFKVLLDELVLNATAMSMHFDREVFVPLKTHDINGVYITMAGIVDKRPLLFPFLVSIAHDLTGYRPANAIGVNAVLSWLMLFVTGRVARRLGLQEFAGWLAVLLLGGLPLLAVNATGGGFEILNLVMIAATLSFAWVYLDRPKHRTLDAFVLCGVLLAQTRYESALFVAAVGIVVFAGWWREQKIIVSWGLIAAPLLLLPVPLVEKVFQVNEGFWGVRESDAGPFGLHYLAANFGYAFEFLFSVDGAQMGSPVLSIVGVVCLTFTAVFLSRRWRAAAADPTLLAFVAFLGVISVNFILLLCYHWGQLQDFVASRLALPLLWLFAIAAAFALGRWIKRPQVWIPVLAVPTAWLLTGQISLSARSEGVTTFIGFRELVHQQEFLARHRQHHDLFVFPSPLAAIVERRPAMPLSALNERSEQMAFHLGERTYENVWIFQRIAIDPVTKAEIPDGPSELGPEFQLETMGDRRYKPLLLGRVSRLVGIDLSRSRPRSADWKPKFPPFEFIIDAEDTTASGRYVQDFVKNLP